MFSVDNQEYFHNWISKAITRSHQDGFAKGSGQGLLSNFLLNFFYKKEF